MFFCFVFCISGVKKKNSKTVDRFLKNISKLYLEDVIQACRKSRVMHISEFEFDH